jgi:polyisoprenoid-binding protein YceI
MRIFIALFMMMSFAASSQTPTAAFIKPKQKEVSKYETMYFQLKHVTIAEVQKHCANYTSYFTLVATRKVGDELLIELRMNSNDTMNRKVVHRLMVALKIQEIESNGKKYVTADFFNKFIY